jgi:TolA-binding protein
MTAKDGLEKLGKTVKLPKDFSAQTQPSGAAAEAARAPLITGPLETLIKNKKHSEAAPKLLEFWASSKSKPGAEEILGALAECLAGSGQAAEAEAVLQYMLTKFGASSDTPVALLKTAQILEAAKKTDDEIYVCEMFLKAFPAHQHACGAAGLVANEYYKKASARLKDAEKAQGDAKKEKTAAAAAAFKTAVPYIKRIITDYPYKADAASSAYELLASAQTLAGLEDEAAKTWLDYRGLLKDNPQKLALVTLSASDSYFSAGRAAAEKARDIRERAMSLPQSDLRRDKLAEADALQRKSKELYQAAAKNLEGFQPGPASDPKTAKNAESAALLAAWASDAAGDKTKAIEKFKAVIKNYPKSEKIPSCMARLGSVYYETGDSAASTQILQELNAKYPASEEAKNAMFNLGKNLYESENYEKAFTAFKGMFSQKVSLPVSSLRWMAETLPSTPGGNSAEGAKLALEASAALMKKIESPDLAEWIGKDRAAALAANPAEKKKTISQLAQKTFLDAGAAANAAGDSKKAVSYLDKVLENKDTPYYFKAKFARADAWLKTGDAEKARGDWSDIAFAAAAARKDSLSSKAKCLLADSYMSDGNYTKALASLRLIAKGLEMESSGAAPPLAATEKDDGARALEREAEKEWVEYAVYKAFVCAGKTGDTALAAQLAGLYKKCFPKGTWLKDIQTGQGK